MNALVGLVLGIAAMASVVCFGGIAIMCVLMVAHFVLTVLINPFYYIATGKNLKAYEEYRDMPREDDFF